MRIFLTSAYFMDACCHIFINVQSCSFAKSKKWTILFSSWL